MPVGYALVEPVQDSLINWHVGETETDARPGTADSGGELLASCCLADRASQLCMSGRV